MNFTHTVVSIHWCWQASGGIYPNQCIQASSYEDPGSPSGTPWLVGQGMPPMKPSPHVLVSSETGDSDVGLYVPLSYHLEVVSSVTETGPPLCVPVWVSWETAHRPSGFFTCHQSRYCLQVLHSSAFPCCFFGWLPHHDFSSPASTQNTPKVFTAVLYKLMENSRGIVFVCNFFKIYTRLNYFWTNTTPFHLLYFESGSVLMLRITFPVRKQIHLSMGSSSRLQNLSE